MTVKVNLQQLLIKLRITILCIYWCTYNFI